MYIQMERVWIFPFTVEKMSGCRIAHSSSVGVFLSNTRSFAGFQHLESVGESLWFSVGGAEPELSAAGTEDVTEITSPEYMYAAHVSPRYPWDSPSQISTGPCPHIRAAVTTTTPVC